MRSFAWLIGSACILGIFGFRSNGDEEAIQAAKVRIAALPRVSAETWKTMLSKHGWLYGSMSAKIKVVGFLTSKADIKARNMLFGSPGKEGDIVCKTIMIPTENSPNWNLASKIRIAYALSDPNKYKTPAIILNKAKQIAETKVGEFEKIWKTFPEDIQKQASEEFESYTELTKRIKVDTYYAALPNDEIVEVGHPFNVEKIWNDYYLSISK